MCDQLTLRRVNDVDLIRSFDDKRFTEPRLEISGRRAGLILRVARIRRDKFRKSTVGNFAVVIVIF